MIEFSIFLNFQIPRIHIILTQFGFSFSMFLSAAIICTQSNRLTKKEKAILIWSKWSHIGQISGQNFFSENYAEFWIWALWAKTNEIRSKILTRFSENVQVAKHCPTTLNSIRSTIKNVSKSQGSQNNFFGLPTSFYSYFFHHIVIPYRFFFFFFLHPQSICIW